MYKKKCIFNYSHQKSKQLNIFQLLSFLPSKDFAEFLKENQEEILRSVLTFKNDKNNYSCFVHDLLFFKRLKVPLDDASILLLEEYLNGSVEEGIDVYFYQSLKGKNFLNCVIAFSILLENGRSVEHLKFYKSMMAFVDEIKDGPEKTYPLNLSHNSFEVPKDLKVEDFGSNILDESRYQIIFNYLNDPLAKRLYEQVKLDRYSIGSFVKILSKYSGSRSYKFFERVEHHMLFQLNEDFEYYSKQKLLHNNYKFGYQCFRIAHYILKDADFKNKIDIFWEKDSEKWTFKDLAYLEMGSAEQSSKALRKLNSITEPLKKIIDESNEALALAYTNKVMQLEKSFQESEYYQNISTFGLNSNTGFKGFLAIYGILDRNLFKSKFNYFIPKE